MIDDVIAAISTAPGRAAVSLLRVSGKGAHQVGARVLRPFNPSHPRRAQRGRVHHPVTGDFIDDVLYTVFAGPASYTGEDVVEISPHGGVLIPQEVLEALLAAGARAATPGEFTRRALTNGKMDLLQAEAVGDLIDATASKQREAALDQYDRGLSKKIVELREQVLALETLVCYEIDFPEEDSGPVSPERVQDALNTLSHQVEQLLAGAQDGERLRDGALAVIAGHPNAGKSSLFNALLQRERAIVTDIAGTTRDAIEAPVSCDGFPFRLVDTAGLRDATDTIEKLGIEVSRKYLEQADVVLFCVDAGRGLSADESAFLQDLTHPAIVVRTKADLIAAGSSGPDELLVSAQTGHGLDTLRERMASLAFTNANRWGSDVPLLTRARHRVAMETAQSELHAFADTRAAGVEVAVAAVHLRSAVTALEDIIGVIPHDEVLDHVFRDFCIGK